MARKDTLQLTKQYLTDAIAGENLFAIRLQNSAQRADAAMLQGLRAGTGDQNAAVPPDMDELTDQIYPG